MAINHIKGIAHVGFFVKDMEVTKKFYCDLLGFETVFERIEPFPEGEEVKISFLKLGDLMLEVICVPGMTLSTEGCFQHIALRVEKIEDAQEKLWEAGIETEELVYSSETFPNGSKWVNFLGPDGEHVEFNEIL